jgi:probable rRNA maturation factor
MIDVEIDEPAWALALPDAAALAEQAAAATLYAVIPDGPRDRSGFAAIVGVQPDHGAAPRSGRDDDHYGSLVVLLTDDPTVQRLNRDFRGKDQPTNVLSFPAAPNPVDHLGDIALAYGVCAAEAAARAIPLGDHLRHLTAHGVLHLLGYDHQIDSEAEAMEALEARILAGLGVADPYGDEGD